MTKQNYGIVNPHWNGTVMTNADDYNNITTTSFSGADMIVHFVFADGRPIAVGTATTLTYSIYREKRQLRTLGRITPKGVTKGPMTVAGSIVFTVINQHVINDIRNAVYKYDPNSGMVKDRRLRMDELPPFDIVISFANEYGQSAKMVIYGVTTVDEAMTFSIEDMFTENTMTYMARDIETMRGPISPGMGMYDQVGQIPDDHSEWLPKYKYDVNNLWANVYKKQQDDAANKLKDKLDKYNLPTPPPDNYDYPTVNHDNPNGSSGGSGFNILVKVVNTLGLPLAPGLVTMDQQGPTQQPRSVDSRGQVEFGINAAPGAQVLVGFKVMAPGYQQVDHLSYERYGPGDSTVTITMQVIPPGFTGGGTAAPAAELVPEVKAYLNALGAKLASAQDALNGVVNRIPKLFGVPQIDLGGITQGLEGWAKDKGYVQGNPVVNGLHTAGDWTMEMIKGSWEWICNHPGLTTGIGAALAVVALAFTLPVDLLAAGGLTVAAAIEGLVAESAGAAGVLRAAQTGLSLLKNIPGISGSLAAVGL